MNQSSDLLEVVEAGELKPVKALLDQGADTEVTDENGLTPLHNAAFRGYRDIIVALVSAGADINARDRFERTPLIHAAFDGHKSVIVYLLLNGADPEAHYHVGLSAFELAALRNNQEAALLLELALYIDLKYARRLARSIASSPSNPSEGADRLAVTRLLEEKGHDSQFEPLITAFLQEIRQERPKPRYVPVPKVTSPATEAPQVSQPLDARRAARFLGVPPESIGTRSSWIVSGSDESVASADVDMLEEGAHISVVMNKTVTELDRINISSSVSALDLFNDYFRRIGATEKMSDFRRTLMTALMLYTDDRFFRVLNECWRSNRSREMLGFSTLMSIAFRHAKYFVEGEVYRGVDLADVDHYQHGLVFRWPFFASASKNWNIAAGFGKTLVTIEVPASANVRDIAYCSLFPEEDEVLFRAYEVFEVLEASPSGIRIRVFYDEHYGTGWEITERGILRQID